MQILVTVLKIVLTLSGCLTEICSLYILLKLLVVELNQNEQLARWKYPVTCCISLEWLQAVASI